MKSETQQLVQKAIKSAFGIDFAIEKIKIDYPPEGMGDYATNVALPLAKNVGSSSMDVAEKVREKISGNDLFEKIEVAKPGFLNFYLSDKTVQYIVLEINKRGNGYGNSESGDGKKIHLDFVSANPTGPVHIGNARGGPLGDTLANVFEKAGYEPYREYYVNDAGNQVEILGHSILGDDQAQYNGEYIQELRKRIGENDARKAGEEGVKLILAEIIKPAMEKFGIDFDNWFSEKELQESGKVDRVIDILRKKGFIYESEGAQWFKSTQFGDDKDRVIVKSTGEKTYFGSDIAYHKEKLDRGFDRLIDIWGADHHGDVARMKGAMEALGYKDKMEILLTQFVRVLKDGKEMKMSKRAGTYVSVDDLIEEVGCDATRFFFLMHSADTHMNFDLNLAKERSEKNPVYYVQYAHARISSILEKAKGIEEKTKNAGTAKVLNEYWERDDSDPLQRMKERALMFELLKFPDLVKEISLSFEVHRLPRYAMDIADKFHSFYDVCRVIDGNDRELTAARLELVRAVQIVLAEVLRLMGISAPEKM